MLDININSLQSVKAIYKYLYETFVDNRTTTDEQRRRIKQRFECRKCLWDESTGKFWKPKHAFQDDVPFFGNRRVTIALSDRTGDVYQLLGQKRSPNVDDYLDFLQELATEYNNTPLNEEDITCTLQVLQRLELQLSLEGGSARNLLIITANNQLRPASEVLIPDAPWRKNYIDYNRILHPQISTKLAKSAGSLSLLKDVIERPTEVNFAINTSGNSWCQEWQNTLNCTEFIFGVKRLIFHEQDAETGVDINWLTTVKVQPASQIKVDLLLKDETRIASAIPGTYYFEAKERTFYIISSSSRYIMLCYLAESINNQLDNYAVQNLLPLASIIDAKPKNINNLLNELRIRSLPVDDNSPESIAPEECDTLREQYGLGFYKWLGYTSILKQDATEGYYLKCTGLGLAEIKAEVKVINYHCPTIRIKKNEWSRMVDGKTYELLIVSHQGKTVEEIIQLSDVWNTLSYAESQVEKGVDNTLIEFDCNLNEQHNDLILNWHQLLKSVHYENIKKYRPIPFEL